jgi:hypothetical protein
VLDRESRERWLADTGVARWPTDRDETLPLARSLGPWTADMIAVVAKQELEIHRPEPAAGQREMSTIGGASECSGWTARVRSAPSRPVGPPSRRVLVLAECGAGGPTCRIAAVHTYRSGRL